jgi:hypothetical protein
MGEGFVFEKRIVGTRKAFFPPRYCKSTDKFSIANKNNPITNHSNQLQELPFPFSVAFVLSNSWLHVFPFLVAPHIFLCVA